MKIFWKVPYYENIRLNYIECYSYSYIVREPKEQQSFFYCDGSYWHEGDSRWGKGVVSGQK